MSNNANIKSMLDTVERIFEAAHETVNVMNDGERMQVKELARVVGLAVAMEPKHVLGFVNHFAHNTDIAFVTRGKNGGIIKGSKPVKVVKASKKAKKTDDAVVTTSAADTTVAA